MPRWHGVGAEHIDIELLEEPSQQGLALLSFKVDGDSLFPDIGSNEIAMSVLACYRPADIPVGIALGFAAGNRSRLQLDHTPAQLDEAKGRICQGECLLNTDNGLRLQDAKFITYGKIDVKLGRFLANWKFFI